MSGSALPECITSALLRHGALRCQVEAIRAGVQPGLTMVVGPPGTGKTDTAVQIMHVLYHNCPTQRTLLITHSNQARILLGCQVTCECSSLAAGALRPIGMPCAQHCLSLCNLPRVFARMIVVVEQALPSSGAQRPV